MRTGLKLSTYFSGVKLRWLIDHHEAVRKAHEEDDLLFGTVESWIVYVSLIPPQLKVPSAYLEASDRRETTCNGSFECLSNAVDEHQDVAMGPDTSEILSDKTLRPSSDCIFLSGVRRS